MKIVNWVACVLVVIGGLNWGLIGFFNYNLVSALFGDGTLTKIIYDVVGLAALYSIFACRKMCSCGASNQ